MGGRSKDKMEDKEGQEEKPSEDYCFVCKDGGLLIVCDHKNCCKSYHPECVGKEDSSSGDEEDRWICRWHCCIVCNKNKGSMIQCFCCPNAVCQSCINKTDMARARGNKGFCIDCLRLALLVEEGRNIDSDGEEVDFRDRETYEGLFGEYWEIVRDKEHLGLDDLHTADAQMKKGRKYKFHHAKKSRHSSNFESDSEDYMVIEDDRVAHTDNPETDDTDDEEEPVITKSKSKTPLKRQKVSNRLGFDGWASKSLIKFLSSIGIDTSERLSQDNVASIITDYVRENNLIDPNKKKRIICDTRLRYVLGRKLVNFYKINDLLEPHYPENMGHSEDDENGSSSDDKVAVEHPKKLRMENSPFGSLQREVKHEDLKEAVSKVSMSIFAAIVPKNIKLAYLWRSLVEKLREKPEIFEDKVTGSFVRIKTGSKRAHQLQLVKGIKNFSADSDKTDILLQLSNVADDIPISMLSDEDFAEEECENLRQQVESGLVERPTIKELEKKARSLHEDITKHWIPRELAFLKVRIDVANEKGWRAQLFEFLERRKKLQSPEEQARLLGEVPRVIADVLKQNFTSEESLKPNDPANLEANI